MENGHTIKQRCIRLGKRFLALGSVLALSWWVLPLAMPLPKRLLQPLPISPTFVAADGSPLRQILTDEGQRVAPPVSYEELPATLIAATLAAEDKRFFSHGGVDWIAVSRAAWDDLKAHRVVSGASTLTEQLAKISADTPARRTLWTKLKEALQARHLELIWSKKRILTEYLNRVSYGNLLTGCGAASQGYFEKPLRDLSPAECAALASLPQGPTRLNPFRHFRDLRKRQREVLHLMRHEQKLSDEKLNVALHEPLVFRRFTGGFQAPHAVDLAIKQAPSEGAVVKTTLQLDLQGRVEGIVRRQLELLKNRHVTHAAAVVIENQTGNVLALAGSRDYAAPDGGQINGAWTPHSPGSALKPFTYLLALEHGFTAATVIPDLPIEYTTSTGLYRPENYDHRNYGPVPLRTALGSSLNIPAVKVLQQIGGEKVLYDALQTLGITTLTDAPSHYGLGLTIGNAPVRLLELTNAYACLARLGMYRPWRLLAASPDKEPRRLFPEAQAYIIADILSDNQARVLTFGPRSVIRLPFPCAVKTGTSTGFRDNWTVGYTPEYTVGVWVGNFDNTPMGHVSGVSGAGPIFRDIFMALHEGKTITWYSAPANVARCEIDPRLGKRVSPDLPAPPSSQSEVFVKDSVPPLATASDYDPVTHRALLPPEYAAWVESGEHWMSSEVAVRTTQEAAPLHITCPVSGTVFYLDADLEGGGERLQLRASGASDVRWESPTLHIDQTTGGSFAKLAPGKHRITAVSSSTGETASCEVEVRDATDGSHATPAAESARLEFLIRTFSSNTIKD